MRRIDADALIAVIKFLCEQKSVNMITLEAVEAVIDKIAEPQERTTEKALRLLLEWAIECDFGYDNIPEEYEKYKDDIEGMSYTDGLIYIARMEVEHEQIH